MRAPSPAARGLTSTSPEGRGKRSYPFMKSRRAKLRPATRLIARPFPIIEYDPSPTAIIEPRRVYKRIDIPKHCVLCFFQDVIDDLVRNGARQIHVERWETGK